MRTYEHLNDTEVRIGDNVVPVVLEISFEHDEYDPGDNDEQVIADLQSGKADCMSICIRARALGIEGFDSLGGCVVYKREDYFGCINEYGMIENATTDLMANIISQARILSKFA